MLRTSDYGFGNPPSRRTAGVLLVGRGVLRLLCARYLGARMCSTGTGRRMDNRRSGALASKMRLFAKPSA